MPGGGILIGSQDGDNNNGDDEDDDDDDDDDDDRQRERGGRGLRQHSIWAKDGSISLWHAALIIGAGRMPYAACRCMPRQAGPVA